MDRIAYHQSHEVKAFLDWVGPFVTRERKLLHQWESRKIPWRCESLYDAYRNFRWRFSVMVPGETVRRKGECLEANMSVLDTLRYLLRQGRDKRDADGFLRAAMAVVDWGGVRKNWQRLRGLGESALPTLVTTGNVLDPPTADTVRLDTVDHLNSGFSKIYALLLDGFPIYDSRVACALGFLVRTFCEETSRDDIPEPLRFGIPASQGTAHRDPSQGSLRFPRLRAGSPTDYARSNLQAAWLLEPLSEMGQFVELPPERRLLALQSALFMIGYQVPARRLGGVDGIVGTHRRPQVISYRRLDGGHILPRPFTPP